MQQNRILTHRSCLHSRLLRATHRPTCKEKKRIQKLIIIVETLNFQRLPMSPCIKGKETQEPPHGKRFRVTNLSLLLKRKEVINRTKLTKSSNNRQRKHRQNYDDSNFRLPHKLHRSHTHTQYDYCSFRSYPGGDSDRDRDSDSLLERDTAPPLSRLTLAVRFS